MGRIGTDESGKGDYFGPLVIAGVYIDEADEGYLRDLGVKDSKKLSDNRVRELAKAIKKEFVYSVVTIYPAKYNELWRKFKNLNKILAWGHARVIENILHKVSCSKAITDKFGNEKFVKEALMKKGRKINLEQKERGEEDLAVACASILARTGFLEGLEKISKTHKIDLPKGAGEEVVKFTKKIITEHPSIPLSEIAKEHFIITKKIKF
ncbi:MAG: ribonuclease HIII [Candidatus Aminicenantia bacterium]